MNAAESVRSNLKVRMDISGARILRTSALLVLE
jgi:hypothetical protein